MSQRVLIIGRSPGVILDAAEILRDRGFHADATNQFHEVPAQYDTGNLDIVLFGGMVPPGTKQYLRDEISKDNSRVTFVQGLAGIAGLIAAQVEGAASGGGEDGAVTYDAALRSVRLTLEAPARVVVEAWWGTSFAPPEPTSTSLRVTDARFAAGEYVVALPDEVPSVASFVTVSAGATVRVFTVGAMPDAVTRLVPRGDPAEPPALPPVRAVATHSFG
jgi:hypothetical protein